MDTPTSFTSDDLFLIRRNPWVLALACTPFLGVPAAIVAGLLVSPVFFAFIFHALLFGGVALLLAYTRNPWPVVERTTVRADANGVEIGAARVPRSEIKAGFIVPGDAPKVELRRGFGQPSITLQGGTRSEERDLLRVLGLDVSQTVATFRTRSRIVAKRRYFAAALGGFFGAYGLLIASIPRTGGHHVGPPAAAILIFALSLIAFVVVTVMPTRLDVGADGIVLTWFGRQRFIAYGDVDFVTRYDKGWGRSRQLGVSVTLKSGEEVLIPVAQKGWNDGDVGIIQERIEEAMEARRQGGAAADAALLRRGDRAPSDWIRALRAIGAGANADMRTAPLPRERLFRIVEDPTAPPADRAAAAVALGGDLDPSARARLRAAAAATAAPRLRIVIEQTATAEDDAALEAALAEVETGEAAVGR
jgi:hypothetical protein